MRTNGIPVWLRRAALVTLLSVSTSSVVSAQTPGGAAPPSLEGILIPGTTVWITDLAGREEKTRILGVSDDMVTIAADAAVRRLRTTDIVRVRARHSDSVINGALIGAGAAVAAGLFMCSMTETWENCRDDVGPMLQIGAIGAGIGIGIDALIRGRRTIYDAAQGVTRLRAAPLVARRAGGLQFSLSF